MYIKVNQTDVELEVINDIISLPTRRDVLKLHLYAKLQEKNIKATDTEVDVLMELYDFGGYDEASEKEFFDRCVSKGYRRSYESVRNVISKFVSNNVILKIQKKNREINESFIPRVNTPYVGLEYKVINATT